MDWLCSYAAQLAERPFTYMVDTPNHVTALASERVHPRYTRKVCYAGAAPFWTTATDTQFTDCTMPYDDGYFQNGYAARHCLPGRYFEPGNNTGACGYNPPCAHQYVGKSQSCML